MKSALKIVAMSRKDVAVAITSLLEVAIDLLDEIDEPVPALMAHNALTKYIEIEYEARRPTLKLVTNSAVCTCDRPLERAVLSA